MIVNGSLAAVRHRRRRDEPLLAGGGSERRGPAAARQSPAADAAGRLVSRKPRICGMHAVAAPYPANRQLHRIDASLLQGGSRLLGWQNE
jgi:hypothetical protein